MKAAALKAAEKAAAAITKAREGVDVNALLDERNRLTEELARIDGLLEAFGTKAAATSPRATGRTKAEATPKATLTEAEAAEAAGFGGKAEAAALRAKIAGIDGKDYAEKAARWTGQRRAFYSRCFIAGRAEALTRTGQTPENALQAARAEVKAAIEKMASEGILED